MTDQEKLTIVEQATGATETEANAVLADAKDRILRRRYPFGTEGKTFPSMYDMLQCDLAVSIYMRKGAEGETSHNENGVNRSYSSADFEELLRVVVPCAKI